MREIREAIDLKRIASSDGQIERKLDESGYPPSLQVLVDGIADTRKAIECEKELRPI